MSDELIIDPYKVEQAKLQAKDFLKDKNEDWVAGVRRLCKTNLYFLARWLGYTRLVDHLHGHLCAWWEQTKHEQFREFLMPRGTFKSTILTIVGGIQTVLPDDVGDQPWPYNLGPECRLVICHEVDKQAQRFLSAITQHFTTNPRLIALFPECVPDPRVQTVNQSGLELPRKSIWEVPTIDTLGVGARGQGRHYNKIVGDDLFGDKARDSKAEAESTLQWFDNIQSFFSLFSKDKMDLYGTRYSLDDLYGHAEKNYGNTLVRYVRSMEEPDENGDVKSIFPEEFSSERLAVLKKNPLIYNAQYQNNPKGTGDGYDPRWRKYYKWGTIGVIEFDETRGKLTTTVKVPRDQLDIRIFVDPAPKGNAGYVITGVDFKFRIFVLKAVRKQFRGPGLIEEIFQDVVIYNPSCVFIEEVNFSSVYKAWLEVEMPRRGKSFRVEPFKTKNILKERRMLGLANYYQAGQIYHGPDCKDLDEDFNFFGKVNPEGLHVLDALAQGPDHWVRPMSGNEITNRRHHNEAVVAATDEVTGYSRFD